VLAALAKNENVQKIAEIFVTTLRLTKKESREAALAAQQRKVVVFR
jgi:hypothetical protein